MQTTPIGQVISVNVGLPRAIEWKGRTVLTSIFKESVAGRVTVRHLDLDGDQQADLTIHGGPDKAVYVYPSEHYSFWREQLPEMQLPWGMFGENLTISGLQEGTAHIGDQFRIGSALFAVKQPRLPCYKLGIKFGRDDILKRFLQSKRTGFYLSVLEEGTVEAGDAITLVKRDKHAVPVGEITKLYAFDKRNYEAMRNILEVEGLTEEWREYFQERLEQGES